jgi:hypothetical protein
MNAITISDPNNNLIANIYTPIVNIDNNQVYIKEHINDDWQIIVPNTFASKEDSILRIFPFPHLDILVPYEYKWNKEKKHWERMVNLK